MRSRPALLVTLAAGLAGGCGDEEPPPVAISCTGDPAAIVEALRTAPDAVELPGGTRISTCVRDAQTAGELQNVGVTLSSAAEELEARAMDGDEDAALQLGYLVGAARTGAKRTLGVSAELVRRLERSAGFEGADGIDAALEEGMKAGERRG